MQQALFDDLAPSPSPSPWPWPSALPEGLRYEPSFLSPTDEASLIALILRLPMKAARYEGYTARRRVVSFGGSFDYDTNRLRPSAALIDQLHPLRTAVARWAWLDPRSLVHAVVAEYTPGTPLGLHRDVPDFEDVFGVSLGGEALLRFRPHPPDQQRRERVVKLRVEPRSIYAMRGRARWAWQHSVAPVDALRWSITFRTARDMGQSESAIAAGAKGIDWMRMGAAFASLAANDCAIRAATTAPCIGIPKMNFRSLLPSVLLGAIASARSMTPMASIAAARLAGRRPPGRLVLLDQPVVKLGALVMGVGELFGDKMKRAPDRTVPFGLLARVMSAGIAGAAMA